MGRQNDVSSHEEDVKKREETGKDLETTVKFDLFPAKIYYRNEYTAGIFSWRAQFVMIFRH